jgi:hypothetical protein
MKNIFLLKTDKPSRLFIDVDDNKLKICVPLGGEHMMNQNIYITNDEVIKEGDYVIVSCSEVNIEEVRIVTGYYNEQFLFDDKSQIHMDYCKKIILTTNEDLIKYRVQSIDDEFLEWFVKNPSCEFVNVKKVESMYLDYGGNIHTPISYKIIFSKEESIQKMLKELEEAACIDLGYEYDYWLKIHSKDQSSLVYIEITNWCKGAMWQSEQDKNKFSKEDMREAIIFGLDGMYGFQWGKEGQKENQIKYYLQELKKK